MTRGQKPDHPSSAILASKRVSPTSKLRISESRKFELCFDFVTEKSCLPCCVEPNNKRNLACNCLGMLRGNVMAVNAVARYMVYFFEKSWSDRGAIIVEWLKYSRDRANPQSKGNFSVDRKFLLVPFIDVYTPIGADDAGLVVNQGDDMDWKLMLRDTLVCKSAIGLLLDIGYDKWGTLQTHVTENTLPEHGNKGKLTGQEVAYKENVEPSLEEYFAEVSQLASPRSTKVIREECCGAGAARNSHDNENETNILDLPTHFSKRGLYARWVAERGWTAKCKPDGRVKLEAKDGVQQKPVCVLSTFVGYWKREHKNLRIQKPSEDICGLCHTYYHSFRRCKEFEEEGTPAGCRQPTPIEVESYVSKKVKTDDNKTVKVEGHVSAAPDASCIYYKVKWEGSKVGEEDDEYTWTELVKLLPNFHPIFKEIKEQELLSKEDPVQALLSKAELHVNQADAQRLLVNKKMKEAVDDTDAKLPHEERRRCVIADFSQSEQLPYFGAEQPGETYYYSPMKINIFGIVNCEIKGGELTSYVYQEGEAKKGGDSVASMLMKFLKTKKWLEEGKKGKELTFVMDNCAGQNKNKMVLRLGLYLVELKYFKRVNFIFLVTGHTKNACDRWFNILKQQYRQTNIYTYKQLIDVFKHPDITVEAMDKDVDFRKWDEFEDIFYKKSLNPGTVAPTHIFTVDESDPTVIKLRRDDLQDSVQTSQEFVVGLKKPYSGPDRLEQLRAGPVAEKPPGLPAIKQVELYEKFRDLIPKQYQDVTCPYPGDKVMLEVKDKRTAKRREKTKLKREAAEQQEGSTGGSSPKRKKAGGSSDVPGVT